MALFMVGPEKHYRLGRYFNEGEVIDVAEGASISHTFIPLDADAKKMWKKRFGNDPRFKMKEPPSQVVPVATIEAPTGSKDSTPV